MSREKKSTQITRRDMVRLSGAAMGGLAFGGTLLGSGAGKANAQDACPTTPCYPVLPAVTQQYSYFNSLPEFHPALDKKLDDDEMRITFLGSMFPPPRRAQQEMSVFVEVGWDDDADKPLDQFIFDCGSGVSTNYMAMEIGYGRMDKIFLNHLHGDHMSDLGHIYGFGPSADRKSPLYVWGPGPSGVRSPRPPRRLYDDGTKAFCKNLREAMRWHTESFSFQSTSYVDYEPPTQEDWGLPHDPVPVGDDPPKDAFALVPIELDWTKYGKVQGDNIAYYNPKSGVKITHFPVIHCRKGSIGYKLEWTKPGTSIVRSMIYTSDTRPETHCIEQAINGGNGIDVLIHEMIVPPEIYSMKTLGLPTPPEYPGPDWWKATVDDITRVQNSSHTQQGAFGFLLSQINPLPRLTVATHFPVADDTVACAIESVRQHVPDIRWAEEYDPSHNLTWSFDLMVIRVKPTGIEQLQGVVSDFGWSAVPQIEGELDTPKYWTYEVDENGNIVYDEDGNPIKVGDPRAQLDPSTEIPATNPDGSVNYCENGY